MRELKFRQPLFYKGKFIEWHYWGHIEGGFQAPVALDLERKSQQYIGQKDKNGKEICAGDIVKDGDYIMQVAWCNKSSSFCLIKKGWLHNHFFNEATEPEECEIIGNVTENPELLKETS